MTGPARLRISAWPGRAGPLRPKIFVGQARPEDLQPCCPQARTSKSGRAFFNSFFPMKIPKTKQIKNPTNPDHEKTVKISRDFSGCSNPDPESQDYGIFGILLSGFSRFFSRFSHPGPDSRDFGILRDFAIKPEIKNPIPNPTSPYRLELNYRNK